MLSVGPSTWEVGIGESQFEASLNKDSERPYLKNKLKKKDSKKGLGGMTHMQESPEFNTSITKKKKLIFII
jgi:hypothetical protein